MLLPKIYKNYNLKFYKNTYKNLFFENLGSAAPTLPPFVRRFNDCMLNTQADVPPQKLVFCKVVKRIAVRRVSPFNQIFFRVKALIFSVRLNSDLFCLDRVSPWLTGWPDFFF